MFFLKSFYFLSQSHSPLCSIQKKVEFFLRKFRKSLAKQLLEVALKIWGVGYISFLFSSKAKSLYTTTILCF